MCDWEFSADLRMRFFLLFVVRLLGLGDFDATGRGNFESTDFFLRTLFLFKGFSLLSADFFSEVWDNGAAVDSLSTLPFFCFAMVEAFLGRFLELSAVFVPLRLVPLLIVSFV